MRAPRSPAWWAAGAVLLVMVADVIPLLTTLVLSADGSFPSSYRVVLSDPVFLRALWNTVRFAAACATVQVGAGLVVGMAVRSLSRSAQLAWFTLLLAPWLLSEVASVVIWRTLLMGEVGVIDRWMRFIGLGPLRLLAHARTALLALVAVATWQGLGFTTIFVVGTLSSIPLELYRASSVYGLNRWGTFVHLEWPLLAPTLGAVWVAVALHAGGQFTLPARLTMGGPGHATTMVSTYLLDRLLTDPTPGASAAAGALVLSGLALLCGVTWALTRRWVSP